MQLNAIDRSQTSRLARALLKAAKTLKIANHFALAERIGVDADSVKIVLTGGRPNTRTAERYDAFLAEVTGKTVVAIAEPTGYFLKSKATSSGKSRRPEVLPAVTARSGLGIHQQVTALADVLNQVQSRLTDANHLLASLTKVSAALDQDPVLREFTSADPATRAALGQLLMALQQKSHVSRLPVTASKSRTLTRTNTRVK